MKRASRLMGLVTLVCLAGCGGGKSPASAPTAGTEDTTVQSPTTDPVTGQRVLKGFVKISDSKSLYIEHIEAAPGQPTVVLLNGLTYRLGCWDKFVEALRGNGLGILRYDMTGQGQTMLKYAPIKSQIDIESQPKELAALLDALNIHEPIHIIGLSYGGGVATMFASLYPERVATAILMAPFVAPVDSQDRWIRLQIQQTRILFPLNPSTDDELYDYFLRNIVFTTYPAAEPIVLENPYALEAVFHIAQGTKRFKASDYVNKLPLEKVHLMVAGGDLYVPAKDHEAFWNQIPKEARASRLFIERGLHKIPEDVPGFAADWVKRIVAGDESLRGGHTFSGSPLVAIRRVD